MPVVKTFKPDEMLDEGVYLILMDTGVLQIKSLDTNRIVGTLMPTTPFENQLSAGGKAKAKNQREQEVSDLLQALEIPVDDARARYLAMQAVIGTKGDNLRSFLKLLEMYSSDKKAPRPIWQICLSDKAFGYYIAHMTDVDAAGTIENWLLDQPDLDTPDFESLMPRDDLKGSVERVVHVHIEEE